MKFSIIRSTFLILCLTAVSQTAGAAVCRHVDQLMLSSSFGPGESFNSDMDAPSWEADQDHDQSVRAKTCQDAASGGFSGSIHSIVGSLSIPCPDQIVTSERLIISFVLWDGHLRKLPDLRPPRI